MNIQYTLTFIISIVFAYTSRVWYIIYYQLEAGDTNRRQVFDEQMAEELIDLQAEMARSTSEILGYLRYAVRYARDEEMVLLSFSSFFIKFIFTFSQCHGKIYT